jgi:hypothetical protein
MRLVFVLKAGDEVVAIAHRKGFATAGLLKTPLEPPIQHVMEVDVR